MHAIHHTDAFVLKIVPSGETNARVWLFTRSFGLVVAMVQGVRKSGSKLSMQLSEYSLAEVDLVRGRDVWRLVNVLLINNPFLGNDKINSELGRSFVRTLGAVERFCQGEEQHQELFEHLASCIDSLPEDLDAKSFDTLSLWKVLVLLGYGTVTEQQQELFSLPFPEAVRALSPQRRAQLVREVNELIKETQL